MARASLRSLVGALREALAHGGADEVMLSSISGAPFGAQRALPYYDAPRGSPRVRDLVNDPDVRSRMLQTIERGMEMDADKWYDTKPLLAAFVAELGPEEGPVAFRRFIDINAAVSPRSDAKQQLKRASFFYGADRRGEGIPWTPDEYGHFAQKVHRALLEKLHKGGFNVKTGPKTASFAENLAGNQTPVTVDSHATTLPAIFSADPRWLKSGKNTVQFENDTFYPRAAYERGEIDIDDAMEQPGWWGGKPLDSEYKPLADYYSELGSEFGMTGSRAQAAAWVGGGDITGVQSGPEPFLAHFVERVRDTAQQRGQSFEETLKRMIHGKEALLSVPLLLTALRALLEQDEGRAART
jgi:hypothetical protein